MCRSIKTLRPPYAEHVTDEDVRAAARQYVKKISGFQRPAKHNAEAFEQAVQAVASATEVLLAQLEIRLKEDRRGSARGESNGGRTC